MTLSFSVKKTVELPYQNLPPYRRRNALLRGEDSLEVERVGRGDRDWLAWSLASHAPQELDGLGKSKLFTGKTGHEAAAANLTAQQSREGRPLQFPSDTAA